MKVEIYSKNGCAYCVKAKAFISDKLKAQYTEYTLGVNCTKQDIEAKLGREVRTVPQIWVNDEYIGGFDALVKRFANTST